MSEWDKKFEDYENMLNDISDSEDKPKEQPKPKPKPNEISDHKDRPQEQPKPKPIPNEISDQPKEHPKPQINLPPKSHKTSANLIKKNLDHDDDDDDDVLNQYENELGIKKERKEEGMKMDLEPKRVIQEKTVSHSKPIAPAPSVPSLHDFMQKDQQYSSPTLIKSLLTIDMAEKEIKKTMETNKNQTILDFQKKKLSQILDNKRALKESLETGNLNYNSYLTLLKDLINKNSVVFSEAKKNGEKSQMPVIAKRLQCLTDEKDKLSANPGTFNSLIQMVFPNIIISAEKKYSSQGAEKKLSSIPPPSSYPQSTFPKMNNKVINLELEDLENLSLEQKIMKFKRRYKQYHNMSLYLYKNMKDSMETELNDHWLPLLQKGKEYLKRLLNKENVDLKAVLSADFPELTTEMFNKIPNSEYKLRLENLCQQVKDCKESENHYLDFLFKSKQSRIKMDEVKKRIEEYDKIFNYLQGLAIDFWIPFPCYQVIKELRSTISENKDIDPLDLHIHFVKSSLFESSLILSYSLTVNKKIMTGDTGPSNDHGAWNSRIVIKMGENKRSVDVGLGQQSVLLSVIKIKSGFFGIGEKRIMMGRGEIPLSEILVNNRVEGKVKISGGEDNTKPFDVEFCIYLRDPLRKENKKEFVIIKLIKTYPKFNKEEGVDEYLKEPLKFTNNPPEPAQGGCASVGVNPTQTTQIEEEKNEDAHPQKIEEEEAPTYSEQIIVLRHSSKNPDYLLLSSLSPPSLFSKEEILMPEIPEKCPCVSFIEKMIELMNTAKAEFSKDYDREASKAAEGLYMKYSKEKMSITMKIEKGIMQGEDYKNLLENGLERDKKLKEFYDSNKIKSWSKFVQTRMNYVKAELDSI